MAVDGPEPVQEVPAGLVGGRFRCERAIGRGQFGAVYLAFDTMIGRPVALKLIEVPPSASEGKQSALERRFLREARALASLAHSGIVVTFDGGRDGDLLYLVMEPVAGPTLREVLASRGRLPPAQCRMVARQLARALQHAHDQGIVHRDIKPENVLLGEDGVLKLTDFGLAKVLGPAAVRSSSSAIVGTPHYMAPEQLRGQEVDGRADQYALAVLLYEALTGRRPFEGSTAGNVIQSVLRDEAPPASELDGKVPAEMSRALTRAFSKDPERRYESCEAFLRAFEGDGEAADLAPLCRALPGGSHGGGQAPALPPESLGAIRDPTIRVSDLVDAIAEDALPAPSPAPSRSRVPLPVAFALIVAVVTLLGAMALLMTLLL